MSWSPPSGVDVTLVESSVPESLKNPEQAISQALDAPVESPPLEVLASGAGSATIVITDSTRPCPDHRIVPGIIERLVRAGIPESRITIVVAIGMHRPSTPAEKIEKLGAEIVGRFRVVDSSPLDPADQVDLGDGPDGTPVRIDRRVVETDLLIATGIVEPHQYAGFSGGWKTVGIGTASAATIESLHGMRYLEDPRVRLACVEENPFLKSMRWIGERARLRFVVNVALDSAAAIVSVLAGHPEAVHQRLSDWVRERAVREVAHPFPIVIGAAGHPKDSNLYQATRIPTYLCFSERPAVVPGGVILVPAQCGEGAGEGPGERLFFKMLSEAGGPDDVLAQARTVGYPAGGQRAVMVAWAQKMARIAFVGTQFPDIVKACGFQAFDRMSDAVDWAFAATGSREVLAVPHALTTLPLVSRAK